MNIGEVIATFREKRGLNQQELADKAIIQLITLKGLEASRFSPTSTELERIAEALEIPVYYLQLKALDVETDIVPEKREAYKVLEPQLTALIEGFFFGTPDASQGQAETP